MKDATAGGIGVHVEEEGEVREGAADGEGVDGGDALFGETAGDALVDGGGVEEAVEEHDGAGGEQGLDFFADELGAGGGEEEEFGLGGHAGPFGGVLEEVADGFANGGASWFTHELGQVAVLFEAGAEEADLRGFATAF